MYRVQHCIKVWEQDDFEKGCILNSGGMTSIDAHHIRATSVDELCQKLNEFIGNDRPDALTLDACDEPGRVDIQVMETDEGIAATDKDLSAWERGELRLWLADYSFYIVGEHLVRLSDAA